MNHFFRAGFACVSCFVRSALNRSAAVARKSLSPEVNISSYPGTDVPRLFFFCRAEILNSGGFVQKYSDQGVSCKNIGQ